MTFVTWKVIARWLRAIGVAALAVVAVIGWTLAIDNDRVVHTLTTTQARQRPVTDFNTAYFVHLDCIKAYETRFFADIASAIVTPPSNAAARETSVAKLIADRDELTQVMTFCPAPSKPEFDDKGNLTKEADIKPQVYPPPNP